MLFRKPNTQIECSDTCNHFSSIAGKSLVAFIATYNRGWGDLLERGLLYNCGLKEEA